jgi:mannan endo-1,4-beta-mannosidase
VATAPPSVTPAPTATPTAPPPVGGFVWADGTQLRVDGLPYKFAGVNIYNANSRDNCWYPLGYGDSALATALSYVPGADALRAWFYQGQALKNGTRDWSAFDHTLAVAAQFGKKVVVQLSGQGGDCGDSPVDQQKTIDWYTSGYKITPGIAGYKSYRDWIAEFAARYAGNPTILAYILVGEAEAPSDRLGTCSESVAAAALRSFADDAGGVIKAVDARHLVTLGVIGTGQCGASGTDFTYVHASPSLDLCTTEDYGNASDTMPGDQWNGMQTRLNQCATLGKPLFVQESGIRLDAESSGSTQTRASLFAAKFKAQFAANVVGELLWDYVAPHDVNYGGGDSRGFDLLYLDPALTMLSLY